MSARTPRFVSDFHGAEYDASIGHDASGPLRSYVICSTPRSGSGLLCRGLSGTGRLGAPLEYFNPQTRSMFTERWKCGSDLESYIDAVHARRTTSTGLFAVKVHWDQLVLLRAEAGVGSEDPFMWEAPTEFLQRVFPNPLFIRITRRDLDRQAISLWRAGHSNIWSVNVGESLDIGADKTPYSFEGIDGLRRAIENGELCWDRLTRERAGDALVVNYEDLVAAFPRTVESVAAHITPDVAVTVPAARTHRLSDEYSAEVLERYRSERRDRMRPS